MGVNKAWSYKDPGNWHVGERSIIIPENRPAKLISYREAINPAVPQAGIMTLVTVAFLDRHKPTSEEMHLPAYLALRDLCPTYTTGKDGQLEKHLHLE